MICASFTISLLWAEQPAGCSDLVFGIQSLACDPLEIIPADFLFRFSCQSLIVIQIS